MKQILVAISLLIVATCVKAQGVEGIVFDENREPIPFASVSVIAAEDSAYVTGTTTDENGKFHIDCNTSEKLLKVSFVGYVTQYLQPKNGMTVEMKEEELKVGDVIITGHRPAYQMKNGTLVAPVQNTILSKLGNADDVLKLLPLLRKKDENFQIVGHKKTLVYINNRLMRDGRELEEINSGDIKDIKLELNPGSKYAADADAVIIITTKRPVGEGLGGRIFTQYNYNGKNKFLGQANLNYRHQKLDVFLNGTYYLNQWEQDQNDYYHFKFNEMPIKIESENLLWKKMYPLIMITSGLNYNFTERSQIGLRYSGTFSGQQHFCTDNHVNYHEGSKVEVFDAYSDIASKPTNHQVNAYYQNTISDKWQINADATYAYNNVNKDGSERETRKDFPSEVNNSSVSKTRLWALKAWCNHQLLGGTAEWGFEVMNTQSDQNYEMKNDEIAQIFPSSTNISKQKAQNVFLTYSRDFGSISTSLGLRYEHVDFDYENNGRHEDNASRIYNNLFPSLSLSYSKGLTNLDLSYRTIVRRPSYYQLRNDVQYNNSFSAEGGNPELKPTYTHRFSMTIQHRDLILDAAYKYHKDDSHFYNLPIGEVPISISNFKNLDMQTYDANLSYSPTFGIWKPSFQIGVSGQILHDNGESYCGIGFNYQWNNHISLPRQWTVIVVLDGNSAQYDSFAYCMPYFNSSVTIQKQIGNWSLSGNVSDIFDTYRDRWSLTTNGVRYEKWNNPHARGFYLRAVYTFNPSKSKYKGGQAGQSELQRM